MKCTVSLIITALLSFTVYFFLEGLDTVHFNLNIVLTLNRRHHKTTRGTGHTFVHMDSWSLLGFFFVHKLLVIVHSLRQSALAYNQLVMFEILCGQMTPAV